MDTVLPPSNAQRALEGDLAVLPLPELLQFLHINGRDGVLVVYDGAGKPRAVLHFAGTQIIADEGKVVEELKLLVRTRWIGFAAGEADFQRWIVD